MDRLFAFLAVAHATALSTAGAQSGGTRAEAAPGAAYTTVQPRRGLMPLVTSQAGSVAARPSLTAQALVIPPRLLADTANVGTPRRRRWPFVAGGAVIGGLIGVVAYTRQARRSDDAFFEPFSTTLVVGGSTGLGALGGLAVGRIAQAVAGHR